MKNEQLTDNSNTSLSRHDAGYRKFYDPHAHLAATFGSGWFGGKAEAFARFFGTPLFLGVQTVLVILWIILNATGLVRFDVYPFILLNLAFSIQAAYSAPLILLAQTRQADRDKAQTEADAQHREALAQDNIKRQKLAQENTERLLELLEQNTRLTSLTNELSARIERLTLDLHDHIVQGRDKA